MDGTARIWRLRVQSEAAGAPVRWDVDLDRLPAAASAAAGAVGAGDAIGATGWIDPDSWHLTWDGRPLPFRADADTLDGRRYTLRFRAPAAGGCEVEAACTVRALPRPAPPAPPDLPVPLIGAGEAIGLGSAATLGDLHVGLQTAVEVVDWYGRGRLDLLVTCHGHEGGAFLYAAAPPAAGAPAPVPGAPHVAKTATTAEARPVFRRVGRLPGFGDDRQSYNGRVRAVDFRGDGRFDLLECRGTRILLHRNTGAVGAPAFAPPAPLLAGGQPFDLGVRLQSLCPVDLGDGRTSLIVGTNDWSDYWPKDVGAWEDRPGYRPYEADGTWRGGPLRGRLYVLRNLRGNGDEPPAFASPVALCHEDGSPLEVYGLAGPAVIPAADAGAGFDLLVSDFLDRIWYFRNTGRLDANNLPRFARREPVRCTGGAVPPIDRMPAAPPPPSAYPPAERLPDELVLPTCMHALVVARWPEGYTDLLVGAEDGYVRALRWAGRTTGGVPLVEAPARLQEYGAHLSVGAKACPNVVDWDGDGRDDLVIGNAAGQVLLSRNAGTSAEPAFGAPQPLFAEDHPLWLMAGPPGTIQGPSEVKWGYVNPAVGTWRPPGAPGVPAIVCGDALGNNTLYLVPAIAGRPYPLPLEGDTGEGGRAFSPDERGPARVSRGRRLHTLREGRWQPLVTRWRCRPQLVDWGDGETVYVQVDAAGRIACYRILADGPDAEDGTPRVAPLDHLRYADGTAVRLDSDLGGRVGRLKLAVADWDDDGLPDLLVGGSGSQPHGVNVLKKASVWLLRNVGAPGRPVLAPPEVVPLEAGQPATYGGHSCVPAPCFLGGASGGRGKASSNERRLPDMLVGSENGRVYAYRRAYVLARARVLGSELVQ